MPARPLEAVGEKLEGGDVGEIGGIDPAGEKTSPWSGTVIARHRLSNAGAYSARAFTTGIASNRREHAIAPGFAPISN